MKRDAAALDAATTHQQDLVTPYVDDLGSILDLAVIREAGVTNYQAVFTIKDLGVG